MELDEVVRQEQDSGILSNATVLRELLLNEFSDSFKFDLAPYKDIVRLVDGYEIMDAINGNAIIEISILSFKFIYIFYILNRYKFWMKFFNYILCISNVFTN